MKLMQVEDKQFQFKESIVNLQRKDKNTHRK